MNEMQKRVDLGGGYYFQPPVPGERVGLILDEDLDRVVYFNGTAGEARFWLDGYLLGLKRGESFGAEKVRRAMRDALGVPHPKAEE